MLKLALRNVFRQRLRTAVTLAAIVVSIVGLILSAGFVEDIFVQLGEAVVHSQTGHLQIAKQGFFLQGTREPEKYLIDDVESIRDRVASLRGIDDAMTRLNFSGLLNNGRADFSIVGEGIEPEREARLGTYMRLSAGRQLRASDRYGILLGDGVARSLHLAPGDHTTLLVSTPQGEMNALEFEVVGVFDSFSKDYDSRIVKTPIAAAQELLNTRAANVIVLTLQQTADTDRVQGEVEALLSGQGLEVKPWQILNDFYSKVVELYDRQLGVLRIIVLILVLLTVTNTVSMTLYERIGEVGTMRAMGNRSRYVFSLLITENMLLGLIGGVTGVVLGILLADLISFVGIPMPPPPNANLGYTAHIRTQPADVASAFLISFAATSLACIPPALRVSRIPVADALRYNA